MANGISQLTVEDGGLMLGTMSKVRLVTVVDEELRDALRLASALTGHDMSDILEGFLREKLAAEIAQIRERRSQGEPKGKRKRSDHSSDE